MAILHTPDYHFRQIQPERILIYVDKKKVNIAKKAIYLGVIIDGKLNFHAHLNAISDKISTLNHAIKAAAGENWGIDSSTLRFYLNNLFLPIVTNRQK